MKIELTCASCGCTFLRDKYRVKAGKVFCSRSCTVDNRKTKVKKTCAVCGKEFEIKPSQLSKYSRTLGVFCSVACSTDSKKTLYRGDANPNYKNRNTDGDGYKLYTPTASFIGGSRYYGGMKLHQAICCELFDVDRMPKGIHIHHRDCDILNNDPKNLVVMSISDHKWIHKQYGVATLWAFMNGRIGIDEIASWSDDIARARWLLSISVEDQAKFLSHVSKTKDILSFSKVKPIDAGEAVFV